MSWMKTIFAELTGLFIEDGSFAFAIILWLVLVWFALPRVPLPHVLQAPLLFLGLVTILVESALRAARHP